MHTFITGSTGSGKSNTVYQMLTELRQDRIPFLVIEPAKGEYKDVFGHLEDVNVYSTNPNIAELININPFMFPPSIHVLEHIDGLVEIFSVCWPMYDAMSSFFKDAILKSYEAIGWDLGSSTFESDSVEFPDFDVLAEQLSILIEKSDYADEIMDMLDCQRRQRPYSEAQMRKLVDMEHIVLSLLISSFQKGISEDNNATILAIFSLLAMFTVSLRTFDELYYFNNHEVLGEDAWHLSHDRWMEVYDTLTSQWFIEKLQDHGIFETSLSTAEVDAYYISLLDQVKDCRCEIKDNQSLIVAMGDADLFRQYKELSTKEVVDSIEAAYREAGRDMDMDESTVMSAFHNAMQQAAMV